MRKVKTPTRVFRVQIEWHIEAPDDMAALDKVLPFCAIKSCGHTVEELDIEVDDEEDDDD